MDIKKGFQGLLNEINKMLSGAGQAVKGAVAGAGVPRIAAPSQITPTRVKPLVGSYNPSNRRFTFSPGASKVIRTVVPKVKQVVEPEVRQVKQFIDKAERFPLTRTPVQGAKETVKAARDFIGMRDPVLSKKGMEKYGTVMKPAAKTIASTVGTANLKLGQLGLGTTIGVASQVIENLINKRPFNHKLDEGAVRGLETSWILPLTNGITDKILSKVAPRLLSENYGKAFKIAERLTGVRKTEAIQLGFKRMMQRALAETPAEVMGFSAWDSLKNNKKFTEAVADNVLPVLIGNIAFKGGEGISRTAMLATKEARAQIISGVARAVKRLLNDPEFKKGSIDLDAEIGGKTMDPAKMRKIGIGMGKKKEQMLEASLQKTQKKMNEVVTDLIDETPPAGRGSAGETTDLSPDVLKQRSFLKTVEDSAHTKPPLVKRVGEIDPQEYVVAPNKQSLAEADRIIKQSVEEAHNYVKSDDPLDDVKGATFIRLMDKAQKERKWDEAVELVEEYDRQLRMAGRGIQTASIWNRLSPQAVLRAAQRAADKANVTLEEDVKQQILKQSAKVYKMKPGTKKDEEMLGLLNFVADKIPPTRGEIFDAYRYQNMLSGPKTQERNVYQNLLNTFVTRPIDIAFEAGYDFMKHPFNPAARDIHFSDVPQYYKNVFASVPNAMEGAVQVFKKGFNPEKIDFGSSAGADNVIDTLRRSKIPKKFTMVPRLMEAEDKFFSTLIAAGEYNRLLKQDVAEGEAKKRASQLAEDYLLRTKLGKDSNQAIVTALDSIGQLALAGRRLPVIGKPWGWFTPFITTPVNAAKMMVRHSPLGFVGKNGIPMKDLGREEIAKAAAGSIVTLFGAMLAAQGRTTWDAPTGQKDKEWFYATGRKPFSVQIGDKWYPMWYLGPFALALGIPAAMKYYHEDSKTALGDDGVKEAMRVISSVSKFVVSQTPLQGISGFFRMLEGDEQFSLDKMAGFTLGQTIPAQSFLRWVTQGIDPMYRKAGNFQQSIMKDIPGMSQNLPTYDDPLGRPSQRLPGNMLLPYDLGQVDPAFEKFYPAYKGMSDVKTINSKITSLKGRVKSGDMTAEEAARQMVGLVQEKARIIQEMKEVPEGQVKEEEDKAKPQSKAAPYKPMVTVSGGGRKGKKPTIGKAKIKKIKMAKRRPTKKYKIKRRKMDYLSKPKQSDYQFITG